MSLHHPVDDPSPIVVTRRGDGHVLVLEAGWPAGWEVPEHAVTPAQSAVSVVVDDDDPVPEGQFTDPRTALLDRPDAHGLLGAVAYGQWRARERFCSRCAQPIGPTPDGRHMRCPEGHMTFPRIEPAVIMRVVDDQDRLLLARQASWPEGRVSVLAGFVDPGEALEDTVRREVMEEVGVEVDEVDYVTSQPWPFPSSLMLAFHAVARTTTIRMLDGEIAEADWFTRDELDAAMAEGRVALPPPLSVAHRLVSDWRGAPLQTWTVAH